MHRIGEGLFGGRFATADDMAQGGIGGDLVTQSHVAAVHAAWRQRIGRQWLGRKPGPKYKAIRTRGPGCNAEAEGVAGSPGLSDGRAQNEGRRDKAKAGTPGYL